MPVVGAVHRINSGPLPPTSKSHICNLKFIHKANINVGYDVVDSTAPTKTVVEQSARDIG
jgi:hypothetical protein